MEDAWTELSDDGLDRWEGALAAAPPPSRLGQGCIEHRPVLVLPVRSGAGLAGPAPVREATVPGGVQHHMAAAVSLLRPPRLAHPAFSVTWTAAHGHQQSPVTRLIIFRVRNRIGGR